MQPALVVPGFYPSHPPSLPRHHATATAGKSAQIARYPGAKFPPLVDFRKACADLIWATFRDTSHNAVCERAERETGEDADKFSRILSGETRKPDAYLMQCVMIIAAARGVAVPPALAVRGQP